MQAPTPFPPTPLQGMEMETARVETLGDGVFAIVITLLVFDLKVPALPVGADVAAVLPGMLWAMWPKFASWVMSFVMVGVYWQAHHGQFTMIRRADRRLIWFNILIYMAVALIPFSASLLGTYPFLPLSAVVYGLNLIMVNLSLALHWRYATRGQRLVSEELPEAAVRSGFRRILLPPAVYAGAIALSLLDPRASLVLYALMPLVYILPTPVDRFFLAPYRAIKG